MKALSIKQPWAWLIVNGWKDIENRSWPTKYRGPVLIHAGKKPDRPFNWDNVPIRPPRSIRDIPHWENFEYGGIVGIAEIVGCVTESESPWFFGEYGFLIRNAQPLPFYPCRGQLGFFDVAYGAPEGGAG